MSRASPKRLKDALGDTELAFSKRSASMMIGVVV
jgi:hypothetical protein